ncbi:MAG: TolC family protein [Nitrospinae bacterium]|nr:TolC family protein [Nitrospinota bacterium]
MRIVSAAVAALMLVFSLPAWAGDKAPSAPAEEGVTMDFTSYLRLMLEKHPELKMVRAEARAKEEVPSQAGSLPDPQLSIDVMDLPSDSLSFTQEDMTRKSIGISQAFPAPGKRDLRRKVAEWDSAASAAMAREKGLELIEQARIAFYRMRYLLAAHGIAEKNKEVLNDFLDISMAKYTVGAGLQQDVLKAQLEYSKMLEYLIRIDQQISTQGKMLNAWAGLPETTDWRRPGISLAEAMGGTDDELAERAVARRPLFAGLNAKLEQAHDALALARRESVPDYAVKFSYSQREDTPMTRSDLISAEVMIDLPVWKSRKQDKMVAEAVLMEEKAREELAAERLRLREKIYELMDEQAKNQKLLTLFDTALIMQASQTVESAVIAYRVNKGDFFTMSMYQSTLFDYQIQRAEVEFELMAARARLLRVLGEDAAEVDNEN